MKDKGKSTTGLQSQEDEYLSEHTLNSYNNSDDDNSNIGSNNNTNNNNDSSDVDVNDVKALSQLAHKYNIEIKLYKLDPISAISPDDETIGKGMTERQK